MWMWLGINEHIKYFVERKPMIRLHFEVDKNSGVIEGLDVNGKL